MSTFIFGAPCLFRSACSSAPAAFCSPKLASLVASVLAKGLYGAFIVSVPGGTGGGSGPEPCEFRLVFSRALSKSLSAVVVPVASSSSLSTVTGGGGGDPVPPSDIRLGRSLVSRGDCGGDMIVTRFLGFPFLPSFVRGGAVAFLA